MRYNSLEKALVSKLNTAIVDVTPGVCVRAYHVGRLICDVQVGLTYPMYDLASLTKIIFTQQAMMKAYDEGLWNFKTLISEVLPDHILGEQTIRSLLTHTSGYDWWSPFYKDIKLDDTFENKRKWLYQSLQKKEFVLKNPKSADVIKALYSDLGFLTLGFILEVFYKKNLLQVWDDLKSQFYPTTTLDFNVDNKPRLALNRYAPTEECPFRKKLMVGEVHDENTWALGGVSNHAGLFGSVDDVTTFGLNLRSQLNGIARYQIKQKTAQAFAERAIDESVGDWATGYMMPTLGSASCGPHFSIHSVGHTGFTGTSLWYDPRQDLLAVVLSNRVNYGRDNKRFVALRPQIHSWLFEAVKRNL